MYTCDIMLKREISSFGFEFTLLGEHLSSFLNLGVVDGCSAISIGSRFKLMLEVMGG